MRNSCLRLCFAAAVLFFCWGTAHPIAAKDNWVRLKSANFELVGNADQKKIREIAIRLEQYRDVFTRLLPGMTFTSKVPTTIMVFKDMKSYGPFRPGNVAGYFQAGLDLNYLSLSAELNPGQSPYSVMFHEYTHLLVHNSSFSDVPTWFNEGLAEYYSTFEINDDRRARIGLIIPEHMMILRQEKLLPLATLFSIDQKSPYYNEGKKQSIFYAQAWLLVHYFIQNDNGARLPQLGRFIDSLLNKVPAEEAFKQAFNATFAEIEKELQAYLKQDSHRLSVATFQEKLGTNKDVALESLDEATALAYQGDLLVHARLKGGDEYLKKSLALDPNSSRALVALGRFYAMTGQPDQAQPLLDRAVAADGNNAFALYYQADGLMRAGKGSLAPELIAKLKANMRKAIEREPNFTEPYRLYAYLTLFERDGAEEAISLLLRALIMSPNQHELRFMLAQLYLKQGEYGTAKTLLRIVAKSGRTEEMRNRAQSMLEGIPEGEGGPARMGDPVGPARSNPPGLVRRDPQPNVDDESTDTLVPDLRRVLPGETRVRGMLTAIECSGGKGIVLVIKTESGVIRVHNDSLGAVEFTSFLPPDAAGVQLKCGSITSVNSVLVTYVANTNTVANSLGEALAVEFISPDLKVP